MNVFINYEQYDSLATPFVVQWSRILVESVHTCKIWLIRDSRDWIFASNLCSLNVCSRLCSRKIKDWSIFTSSNEITTSEIIFLGFWFKVSIQRKFCWKVSMRQGFQNSRISISIILNKLSAQSNPNTPSYVYRYTVHFQIQYWIDIRIIENQIRPRLASLRPDS